MDVIRTQNLGIYISKVGAATTALVPTSITSANPAVVTVADVTGLVKGDVIVFSSTGFPELDRKTFVIGTITTASNEFEVIGSDTSASTATLGGTPSATVYHVADMVRLCLDGFEVSAPSTSEIDISTYCKVGSIPGATTPGSLSMTGNVAKGDTGFAELEKANFDGQARTIIIVPQGDNGYWVGKILVSGLGYTFPMADRIQFSFTGTQEEVLHWVR